MMTAAPAVMRAMPKRKRRRLWDMGAGLVGGYSFSATLMRGEIVTAFSVDRQWCFLPGEGLDSHRPLI